MRSDYQRNGYFVIKNLFTPDELQPLHAVLHDFHIAWQQENADFYQAQAINSAYLTGTKYLNDDQRRMLFAFIGQHKIMDLLGELIPGKTAFMNTQLFFNPVNPNQQNYWHRDIQYNGMSIEAQQKALQEINVIHFRIAFAPEHGLELVPGTHYRWDSVEEFDVRMEQNGRKCFEPLTTGKQVPLAQGDLLVFSANMIHRGLYGLNRFAFDILFCDATPELLQFSESDCLPDEATLATLDVPDAFVNTLRLKSGMKH